VISFLKKNTLSIAIWLLIFPLVALSSDEFIVKDIKIEGLEKISEGALLNYLPVNIGDNLNLSFDLNKCHLFDENNLAFK